jgi:ATP-dependent DNA helicase RecG
MSSTALARQTPPNLHALLGPLTHFGLTEAWQAALLLPRRHIDLQHPAGTVHEVLGQERIALHLVIASQPKAYYRGAPRVSFRVTDSAGTTCWASIFGDTKEWLAKLSAGQRIACRASVRMYQGEPSVTIDALLDGDEGGIEVVYPERTRLATSEEVATRVRALLPRAIPRAARFLEEAISPLASPTRILEGLGCPGWTLEQVLLQAHQPISGAYGQHALTVLRQIAAIATALKARHATLLDLKAPIYQLTTLEQRLAQLPYAVTHEQRHAIYEIAGDLATGRPMRRLLAGDVGCGKTVCFGAIVAALHDAGGRAAILLPNTILATQVARELLDYWPDLDLNCVTGDSASRPGARLIVGTTAILHRSQTTYPLVVIDEEQKFSTEQKQQLIARNGHQLIVSATCMPRSLALAQLGTTALSTLRTPHAPKIIHTTLWAPSQRVELFDAVRRDLRSGHTVVVVYPLRGETEQEDGPQHSVENAREGWERLFPGKVRTLVGTDTEQTKEAVLQDLRERRAQVLLATTAVEVGVTIPRLSRVVIIHPERHGLMTLHQIRGRVARQGGEGFCDLYLPNPVKADTRERLEVFERTSDGFALAEYDLQRRGMGDLAEGGRKQSGSDESLLFGHHLTPADLDAVYPLIDRLARPTH